MSADALRGALRDEYSAVPDVVWCPFVIGSVHPDAHKKIGWPCVEDHQTLYFRTPSSASPTGGADGISTEELSPLHAREATDGGS